MIRILSKCPSITKLPALNKLFPSQLSSGFLTLRPHYCFSKKPKNFRQSLIQYLRTLPQKIKQIKAKPAYTDLVQLFNNFSINNSQQYINKHFVSKLTEKQIKFIQFAILYLIFAGLIFLIKKDDSEKIQLEKLRHVIVNNQTDTITVRKNTIGDTNAYELYFLVNGEKYHYHTNDLESIEAQIARLQSNLSLRTKIIMEVEETFQEKLLRIIGSFIKMCMPLLFPILILNSKLGKMLQSQLFGQAESIEKQIVKFKDIAGLGNAKIEVSELVDFLKHPQRYKQVGAKVPKGALLAGPPGTGKTMLAKACAGQANVPFFSVSGSQFVELFAGMGAKRVRQLFANAKKQKSAIIFIDQIDAIGRKRQDKFGGAHDERANTLNQLLVQMDGFGTSDDVIVLAATNRKQMLDNALTRPGRFDRIVQIQLPDLKGRKQILEIYLKKIKLSPNKTLQEYAKRIATLTFGFSGADLANLCNQAAILAVRRQKAFVQAQDFQSASDRVLAGLQQTTALSDLQKRKVAYHESGHAVTAWFLQGASPLLKITIIPRSKGALGFAQYLPNESTLATKEDLLDQMCVILGGRISQQLFFGEITNGASDDLQKVRQLAYAIIVTYGMSQRNTNYAPVHTDGHNIYSEQTAAEIDKQIIQLIGKATEKAREILSKHKDKISGLAEAVLKKQTLNHQQIREILGERPFPSKQNYKQFIEEITKQKKSEAVV